MIIVMFSVVNFLHHDQGMIMVKEVNDETLPWSWWRKLTIENITMIMVKEVYDWKHYTDHGKRS